MQKLRERLEIVEQDLENERAGHRRLQEWARDLGWRVVSAHITVAIRSSTHRFCQPEDGSEFVLVLIDASSEDYAVRSSHILFNQNPV